MAQHFLLSSKARSLSLIKISKMSNKQALQAFASMRWFENNGTPICPNCGNASKFCFIETRSQFKCQECQKRFSATSGTIFHAHKLSLQTILMAIALFTNSVKGPSALQLSRELDIQYKTAFVLLHKIRESLMDYQDDKPFSGTCELDGVYVGHYLRPENKIKDRIDRHKAYKPNKRVVISLRQRHEFGLGASRTRTFVLRSENPYDINKIVHRFVEPSTEIHTDESVGYSDLIVYYNHKIVNHSVEYTGDNGENNNQSESCNARFRRMQHGQIYKMGLLYLSNYANEIAYREDTRRHDNGFIFRDILKKCLKSNISNEFCGYWQGNKRVAERLGA